jgi:hypothetical protein
MFITRTVTKKILETLVHETFSQFGSVSSSSLLDSLKLLGFYYATNAGISINIEDLKTPNVKREFIKTANDEIVYISKQWEQGFVSDTERFQTIIDSWNVATESLKDRIVEYYQNFDPANNLYIMAFSGARGNMSQVRQLVGMRGLMSDQEGKIIDLPIQANFREGLTSIDYIISSYGARKGIVDTALKTADSGYLTRRLIYIAQDLVIREKDCQTKDGVIILLNKSTNIKNIIGRSLISAKFVNFPYDELEEKDLILTKKILTSLKSLTPLTLNVCSSLTCKSNGSVCQKCYGWDLAHEKIISLGEAVGIIAAQSIGEPGTQLTMRTFHTGGIFTGETLKQIIAPFSGKLIIPTDLKVISYRTNHGVSVLQLKQEVILTILNWKGLKQEIFLDIGSNLYISKSSFIKKGALIAELSTQNIIPGGRRLKPIYTSLSGEIRFENLFVRKMFRDKRTIKINQDDGVLWIASGKVFPLPKEIKYLFPNKLEKIKPFAYLKLITPFQGIINYSDNVISIINKDKKISFSLTNLTKTITNCSFKFSPIIRNYQYVDKYTILSFLEIFPNYEGMIYSVRKKNSKYINTLFMVTDSDIWKINSEQINNFSFFPDKKIIVRSKTLINNSSKLTNSGFFLKKDGFKMIFQNAMPIFLSRGTILNYKQEDFVLEKKVFATLVNYTQQTEDIVQGLPKIEELIEARKPKTKSYLSIRPGIFLNSKIFENYDKRIINSIERNFQKDVIKCIYPSKKEIYKIIKDEDLKKSSKKKSDNDYKVHVIHSIFLKEEIIVCNNKIYKILPIPTFEFNEIQTLKGEILSENQKISYILNTEYKFYEKDKSNWEPLSSFEAKLKKLNNFKLNNKEYEYDEKIDLYRYINNSLIKWKSLNKEKDNVFINKNNDLVFKINNNYIFLEYLNPISSYKLALTSKVIFQPGNFIDIGEPITEGIIDAHELLQILFKYHSIYDGVQKGTKRSLSKFQLLLVNSIQSIYQSQGVNISSKHIEIIVKQMTSKVVVTDSGDTPLLPTEFVRLSLINEICESLKIASNNVNYKTPKYEPLLLSATNSSLSKDGFLSAAGFQETKRVLTKAAIEGSSDWLRGLKECVIIGRLIPAGSAFLNYKNYLDNIYLFKQ